MIEVPNTVLKYSYVGLLLPSFILSLGNPPQGSKRGYTTALVGYAILTLCMTVRYRDRGWHISELADGGANLVYCDVPNDQRRAAGV